MELLELAIMDIIYHHATISTAEITSLLVEETLVDIADTETVACSLAGLADNKWLARDAEKDCWEATPCGRDSFRENLSHALSWSSYHKSKFIYDRAAVDHLPSHDSARLLRSRIALISGQINGIIHRQKAFKIHKTSAREQMQLNHELKVLELERNWLTELLEWRSNPTGQTNSNLAL